jgi:hypothetical protein
MRLSPYKAPVPYRAPVPIQGARPNSQKFHVLVMPIVRGRNVYA